jgi:pimeloyl-ACP methyl ester carboxylesterase
MTGFAGQRAEFPVRLQSGVESTIVGFRYGSWPPPAGIVQVLVHGGTYDHRYWDTPDINGHCYSYARHMAGLGYPVLAIDVIGTGESGRPGGDLITLEEAADTLAQVISQTRKELSDAGATATVALVGHSIGTILSVYCQARHHPADLLVTTGLGHVPVEGSPFPPGVVEEAMTAGSVVLPGFARAQAFYDAATADPEVIAFDNEQLAQPIARGLLADAFAASGDIARSLVQDVTGPVFVQLADRDVIGPGALAGGEAAAWSSTDDVTVETIEGLGHCFNLHRANEASWRGIHAYLSSRVWPSR